MIKLILFLGLQDGDPCRQADPPGGSCHLQGHAGDGRERKENEKRSPRWRKLFSFLLFSHH